MQNAVMYTVAATVYSSSG